MVGSHIAIPSVVFTRTAIGVTQVVKIGFNLYMAVFKTSSQHKGRIKLPFLVVDGELTRWRLTGSPWEAEEAWS